MDAGKQKSAAIEVQGLAFTYPDGTEALRGVTFAVAGGEAVGLVGPNGAGKSTLTWLLSGFLEPAAGCARICGLDVCKANLAQVRRRLGVIFQNPDDQLFMPTLFDDVAFGLLNLDSDSGASSGKNKRHGRDTHAGAIEARVIEALQQVGLESERHRFAGHLSAGQKRLAALAAVLVVQPDVLVLDEPTSDLDPRARRRFIEQMQTLPQTRLIASHDLEMILDLCPRVLLLDQGVVAADGPAVEILGDAALVESHGLEVPYSLRRDHTHRFPLRGTPHEMEHRKQDARPASGGSSSPQP
ncbi:MAG: energy-coupling factor ABC transporter ATP-binding protein [Candidatus Sumerlaeia bacterium]|nr:energy-coupling factor ABC transporter ATP-binding protein [Candidatus Sumerlaeia bacterium]